MYEVDILQPNLELHFLAGLIEFVLADEQPPFYT
jgi:hypothetical protein